MLEADCLFFFVVVDLLDFIQSWINRPWIKIYLKRNRFVEFSVINMQYNHV